MQALNVSQILSLQDSLFSSMFEACEPADVSDAPLFIDRDGEPFAFVLDFLRCGLKCTLPEDSIMLKRVRTEADYYQLPQMVEMIDKANEEQQPPKCMLLCLIEIGAVIFAYW